MKLLTIFLLISFLSLSNLSYAIFVDFTGGTIHQYTGLSYTTNASLSVNLVDYYEEEGVLFDFIGPPGNPFSYHIGDYYGVGNDVIHGHWQAGPYGDMERIHIEKLDKSAFDLNYFKITTNTGCGGCPAFGSEEIYVNALADGINVSHSMLLPPDDWGFAGPNSEIYLGQEFQNIMAFSFTYGANAVGFGLDEFFIDEAAPGTIPEPIPLLLMGLGLLVMSVRFGRKM